MWEWALNTTTPLGFSLMTFFASQVLSGGGGSGGENEAGGEYGHGKVGHTALLP